HRLVPCDTGTIFMLQPDGSVRVRRWTEGQMEDFRTVAEEHMPEFRTSQILRENGQPLVINDCATDPRWVTMQDHRPIQSWLGAPLIHRGEFFGELNLDSKRPHNFSQGDAVLVHALATQVAAALYGARQFEAEQRRAQRMQALNELYAAIGHLDLDAVLEVLYQRISDLMDTRSFYVALYEAEPHQIRLTGAYERGERVPDISQDANLGLTGQVLKSRQSIIIHDLAAEGLPDGAIVQGDTPRSLVMIPLFTQDEIVGVLSVQSDQPHAYTPGDLGTLELMAGAIATAVRNAQLYDQTVARLAALETLHQIDLQLTNVQDPHAIVLLTIQAVRELFQPTEVQVCLCHELPWPPRLWTGGAAGAIRVRDCPDCVTPPAGSLAAYIMQTHERVMVADLNQQPELQATFDTPWPVGAMIAYPIYRGAQLFGILTLLYDQPHFFRQDMLRTLGLLASQAAAALDSARHTLTLSRRLAEVSALQELARRVSACQSLDSILHTVVQAIRDVYGCKSASLALLEPDEQVVLLQASVGIAPELLERARFEVGEYVAGQVVQTGQAIYVPDTHADPNFRQIDPSIRSMLTVPLKVQDRVIGALSIDSAQVSAFDHEHERVLTIAGNQIAATIETVRRTRELAEANTKLKAQDQLREELVIQVSHDLRSPLSLVQGYAGLLYDGAFGPVNEKQDEILRSMEQRSDSIKQLTEDIIATHPIDRSSLALIPLDIAHMSRQAVRDAGILYADNDVPITFAADVLDGQHYIEGDVHRLNRVFDNLISNAVKFSPDGGTITIRTRRDPDQRRMLVSIIDQGIGISAAKLPHIFERFFRGDKAFRDRFKGTGVGLFNTWQIIAAHNGAIWADSDDGQGSTFTFALPLAEGFDEH
ncbi:MAG: GAF domain-containing protein, partial [Anaerolineae bacterium]|nr:GAF domain-containing protein [Anaerolineae bacterium]